MKKNLSWYKWLWLSFYEPLFIQAVYRIFCRLQTASSENFMMIFWSRHYWFCFLGEEADVHSNRKLSTQIILKISEAYISWDPYLSIKCPNFYSCANTTNSHCSMSCSRIIDNCYCTLRRKSPLHILLLRNGFNLYFHCVWERLFSALICSFQRKYEKIL